MKKVTILIIGILSFFHICAADVNSLQDSALNYYLKQDFENALVFYDSINRLGYSSSDLYFNIGNCCFKTGNIAGAVLYFEKALVLNPTDNDIKNNLKIAQSAVRTKTEQLPEVFYKRWFNKILSMNNSDNWLWMSVIFFVLSLAAAGLYLFSRKLTVRKIGFSGGIALLIFSVLFGIFAKIQANKIISGSYAVVFESSMIKSSPSEDGTNLFEISEGMKVEITDTLNNWSEIRLTDGKEGWIESAGIKRI